MLDAAVEELRHRGVAGMSFTHVLDASGAARGAIYHHFPGGKAQLVAEAAAANADTVTAALAAVPGTTTGEVVESFLSTIRPVVAASAAGSGCAVAAVTVEADDALRDVADEAFAAWSQALAERLTAAGLPRDEAAALATTLITLLEGAHVLSRAAGTLEPFDAAADTILDLVRSRYGAEGT